MSKIKLTTTYKDLLNIFLKRSYKSIRHRTKCLEILWFKKTKIRDMF